jgi:hypothetical protein
VSILPSLRGRERVAADGTSRGIPGRIALGAGEHGLLDEDLVRGFGATVADVSD